MILSHQSFGTLYILHRDDEDIAPHIAHDPARVLREVEAKRHLHTSAYLGQHRLLPA